MNDTIKENLKSIQQFAILALDKHKRSGVKFSGVNYASVRVSDVWVKYSIHDEDLLYGITIDECSPTVYELQEYMVEYLKDNLPDYLGWCIYVELEW
jgi:hypothetical protein